jgi:hypothetical protein
MPAQKPVRVMLKTEAPLRQFKKIYKKEIGR